MLEMTGVKTPRKHPFWAGSRFTEKGTPDQPERVVGGHGRFLDLGSGKGRRRGESDDHGHHRVQGQGGQEHYDGARKTQDVRCDLPRLPWRRESRQREGRINRRDGKHLEGCGRLETVGGFRDIADLACRSQGVPRGGAAGDRIPDDSDQLGLACRRGHSRCT